MAHSRSSSVPVVLAVALALLFRVLPVFGQNAVSEEQARKFAAQAAAKAGGDERKFEREFRDLVRTVLPKYDRAAVYVHYSEGLTILVVGPLSMFHGSAATAIRKLEPIDKVEWVDGVTLLVSPNRIDAPNIEKVVVMRGGQPIEPEINGLEQTELTTRMGAKVMIGAGAIKFSSSAFSVPGPDVVVTAIPKSGSNIVKTLKDSDLRKLQ